MAPHTNGREPPDAAPRPLGRDAAVELRRGVGRLQAGAGELVVIALVMPVFLAGLELATLALVSGGFLERTTTQRTLDLGLFGGYALVLVALAVRARIGAARAVRLLPALLDDDAGVREDARARLLRLAGPEALRRLAERVAERGCLLLVVLGAVAILAAFLLPIPNPFWLTIFAGTAVAMDVRWRALVADVADQLPSAG